MKISVITPAIRRDELELNHESLKQQSFRDFEWIVCSPFEYEKADIWVKDPPKNPGDFMGENKAYNELFLQVSGDLVVTLNDSIWLAPDALEKLWEYFTRDPKSCFCFTGNHYKKVMNGKGFDMTYEDVRRQQYSTPTANTTIQNFDACVSSIPITAV